MITWNPKFDTPSSLEIKFARMWNRLYPDIPLVAELEKAVPGRRFRIDFAHVDTKLAIELQGGTYSRRRGGHSRGAGQDRDYEKQLLLAQENWTVVNLSTKMITIANLAIIALTIQRRSPCPNILEKPASTSKKLKQPSI